MLSERVVVDTNVLISALLIATSQPRSALELVLQNGTLLMSDTTIAELVKVLAREKLSKYVSPRQRMEFLTSLVNQCQIVKPNETITDCRDESDNRILEGALAGQATCIITGDRDLLALHPWREIPILSPADFLSYHRG